MTDKQPQVNMNHSMCARANESVGGIPAHQFITNGCGRTAATWLVDKNPEQSTKSIPLQKAAEIARLFQVNLVDLISRSELATFTQRYGSSLGLIESTLEDDGGLEHASLQPNLITPTNKETLKKIWEQKDSYLSPATKRRSDLKIDGVMGLLTKKHRDVLSFFTDHTELLSSTKYIREVDSDQLAEHSNVLLDLQKAARNPSQHRLPERSRKQSDSIEDLISGDDSIPLDISDDLTLGDSIKVFHHQRFELTSIGFSVTSELDDDHGERKASTVDYSFPSLPVKHEVFIFAPIKTKCILLQTQKFPCLSYEFFSEFEPDGSPGPHGFTFACKKSGQIYRLSDSDLDRIAPYRDDYS